MRRLPSIAAAENRRRRVGHNLPSGRGVDKTGALPAAGSCRAIVTLPKKSRQLNMLELAEGMSATGGLLFNEISYLKLSLNCPTN